MKDTMRHRKKTKLTREISRNQHGCQDGALMRKKNKKIKIKNGSVFSHMKHPKNRKAKLNSTKLVHKVPSAVEVETWIVQSDSGSFVNVVTLHPIFFPKRYHSDLIHFVSYFGVFGRKGQRYFSSMGEDV